MRAGLVPDHFPAPLLLFSFLLLCPLGVELRDGDSLLVDLDLERRLDLSVLAGLDLEYFGIVYLKCWDWKLGFRITVLDPDSLLVVDLELVLFLCFLGGVLPLLGGVACS